MAVPRPHPWASNDRPGAARVLSGQDIGVDRRSAHGSATAAPVGIERPPGCGTCAERPRHRCDSPARTRTPTPRRDHGSAPNLPVRPRLAEQQPAGFARTDADTDASPRSRQRAEPTRSPPARRTAARWAAAGVPVAPACSWRAVVRGAGGTGAAHGWLEATGRRRGAGGPSLQLAGRCPRSRRYGRCSRVARGDRDAAEDTGRRPTRSGTPGGRHARVLVGPRPGPPRRRRGHRAATDPVGHARRPARQGASGSPPRTPEQQPLVWPMRAGPASRLAPVPPTGRHRATTPWPAAAPGVADARGAGLPARARTTDGPAPSHNAMARRRHAQPRCRRRRRRQRRIQPGRWRRCRWDRRRRRHAQPRCRRRRRRQRRIQPGRWRRCRWDRRRRRDSGAISQAGGRSGWPTFPTISNTGHHRLHRRRDSGAISQAGGRSGWPTFPTISNTGHHRLHRRRKSRRPVLLT